MQERRFTSTGLTARRSKRSGSAASIVTISGWALLFNSPSEDLGFIEIISPTALDGCDFSGCVALFNHDSMYPLAKVAAGNLRLNVDRLGLKFEADLDSSITFHNDTIKLIEAGTADQCSFAFYLSEGGALWFPGDLYTGPGADDLPPDTDDVRVLTSIACISDVSVVVTPAYSSTSVSVQS